MVVLLSTEFNARDLEIAWVDDPAYWKWIQVQVPQVGGIITIPPTKHFVDAAELLRVSSLEVHKRVSLDMLQFNHFDEYEAAFKVKMKEDASGWDDRATLEWKKLDSVETPHITYQDMRALPKDQLVLVKIGTFKLDDIKAADIEFTMSQEDSSPKSGLILVSLLITPILRKT